MDDTKSQKPWKAYGLLIDTEKHPFNLSNLGLVGPIKCYLLKFTWFVVFQGAYEAFRKDLE